MKMFDYLENWELMSQMLLSDGKDTANTTIGAAALHLRIQGVDSTDSALTSAMLQHLWKLLIFRNPTNIESASGEPSAKALLLELHRIVPLDMAKKVMMPSRIRSGRSASWLSTKTDSLESRLSSVSADRSETAEIDCKETHE
jgi:hypothetical protein